MDALREKLTRMKEDALKRTEEKRQELLRIKNERALERRRAKQKLNRLVKEVCQGRCVKIVLERCDGGKKNSSELNARNGPGSEEVFSSDDVSSRSEANSDYCPKEVSYISLERCDSPAIENLVRRRTRSKVDVNISEEVRKERAGKCKQRVNAPCWKGFNQNIQISLEKCDVSKEKMKASCFKASDDTAHSPWNSSESPGSEPPSESNDSRSDDSDDDYVPSSLRASKYRNLPWEIEDSSDYELSSASDDFSSDDSDYDNASDGSVPLNIRITKKQKLLRQKVKKRRDSDHDNASDDSVPLNQRITKNQKLLRQRVKKSRDSNHDNASEDSVPLNKRITKNQKLLRQRVKERKFASENVPPLESDGVSKDGSCEGASSNFHCVQNISPESKNVRLTPTSVVLKDLFPKNSGNLAQVWLSSDKSFPCIYSKGSFKLVQENRKQSGGQRRRTSSWRMARQAKRISDSFISVHPTGFEEECSGVRNSASSPNLDEYFS